MEGKEFLDKMQSHQYQDIYKSDDVPFHDLSKTVSKRLIQYGVGLFIVLLILSFIIKIPREVHIPFELKGGLNEIIFQYPEIVYIEEFIVQANDSVAKGDSLLKISSPKIIAYIEEYENWKAMLELYKNQKEYANKQSIALLQSKHAGTINEIAKLENEKSLALSAVKKESDNLNLQLENAKSQHERNTTLHNSQVISDMEFEASQLKVQETEQKLISRKESYALIIAEFDSRLQQLSNNRNQYKLEIEKQYAEFEYELAEITKNYELSGKKISLNYGAFEIQDNSIVLLSPVNGVVTLKNENEYRAPNGEILLRIQTDSLGFYAYAEAGPTDIGHVKAATKSILKFKSFPHYYYGTMRSEVVSISPSPAENGNFPIKLKIIDMGRLGTKVNKGMTGTASFVVEEKSVFDFILRGFLKLTTIE